MARPQPLRPLSPQATPTRGDTAPLSEDVHVRVLASAALWESAYIWAVSRALFLVLTYLGVILTSSHLHDVAHPSYLHRLLPAWDGKWDTQWYIDIAHRGYAWKKAVGTSPTAFFPLYPLSIRVATMLTHRSYITAALAVSNACFLAALIYLWKLTRWELGPAAASRAVLYIAVFPTALFFFAGYSESLFLLLTVASFYHMRRGDWLLAGMWGGLASATRVTGILLLLPFLYEYGRSKNFSLRRLDLRGLVAGALIPAGLLGYMLYLQAAVGNALAFTHSQEAWQKVFTVWLPAGILESLRQIFIVQPAASFFEAHNLINLGLGALMLLFSVQAARKLPPAYSLYLAGFWIVTLSSPAMANGYPVPLISLSRYVLTLFPAFMVMGLTGTRPRFHNAYLVLAPATLAVFTVQFLTGGWII